VSCSVVLADAGSIPAASTTFPAAGGLHGRPPQSSTFPAALQAVFHGDHPWSR
jgi:hypothetical protein